MEQRTILVKDRCRDSQEHTKVAHTHALTDTLRKIGNTLTNTKKTQQTHANPHSRGNTHGGRNPLGEANEKRALRIRVLSFGYIY